MPTPRSRTLVTFLCRVFTAPVCVCACSAGAVGAFSIKHLIVARYRYAARRCLLFPSQCLSLRSARGHASISIANAVKKKENSGSCAGPCADRTCAATNGARVHSSLDAFRRRLKRRMGEGPECCRRTERSFGPPSRAGDRLRTTAVDRRSTPSARADRQEPLPMFRCPGSPGFP